MDEVSARLQIREAGPEDAAAVLAHLHAVLSEPEPVMIPLKCEEMKLSVEDERRFLADLAASPTSLFLIAHDGDQVVGNIDLKGMKAENMAHVAMLGMAIQAPWRGRGLGRRLLDEAMRWAAANPLLRRVELYVYAENAPAIALYLSSGFELEGRRKGMVRYQGRYCDDLIMARCFER